MSDRICVFPECDKPRDSRGWCGAHYKQWQLGKPLVPLRVYPTPIERFWSKADQSGGPNACWPWTDTLSEFGYGGLSIGRKVVRAHRFAYETFIAPIPAGMMVDHMCHNLATNCAGGATCPHRACVNPAHLALATARQNSLRSSVSEAGKHARQTHCKRGHEFTPENTYQGRKPWHRRCATCCAIRYQRSKAKRAA